MRVVRSGLLQFHNQPGRPHQNGIENASIKFADNWSVKLITAHDGDDPLARRCGVLKPGEGASSLFALVAVGGGGLVEWKTQE